MRILLTGISGQVGRELQRSLQPLGEIIACDRARLDLANPDSIRKTVREISPGIIVNPAAYTAVDKAESEADRAMAINGTAPGTLAEEARRLDALLVHYSTDYVFDGSKPAPYTEDDPTAPLGSYGRSKRMGEEAIAASDCRHLIFRTAWVYGLHGHNFLRTVLRLAAERDELRIVADQFGTPTWSRMIAETTAMALARYAGQQGIYHLAAEDWTSWHGFAETIVESASKHGLIKKTPLVRHITTADYPSTARRPANSRLSCKHLLADFNLTLPDWRSQLQLCLS